MLLLHQSSLHSDTNYDLPFSFFFKAIILLLSKPVTMTLLLCYFMQNLWVTMPLTTLSKEDIVCKLSECCACKSERKCDRKIMQSLLKHWLRCKEAPHAGFTKVQVLICWCFEPSQPLGFTSGLHQGANPSSVLYLHHAFSAAHVIPFGQWTYHTQLGFFCFFLVKIQTYWNIYKQTNPLK